MLETTKEEYFTPQHKVFVSVFSIKFSLVGYHVFQLGKSTSGLALKVRN